MNKQLASLLLTSLFVVTSVVTSAKALAATPVVQSPDVSIIDTKADPCDDFFQYACGGWLSKTEIPGDRPAWDRSFSSIDEQNQYVLKDILENFAKMRTKADTENPYAQKLGDFYSSCIDESKVEKSSFKTLKEQLKRIDAVTKDNLAQTMAWLYLSGTDTFFSFGKTQDYKNPQEMIAEVGQGGQSLPTKDYYLDTSDKRKKTRADFLVYAAKMLELSGEKSKTARADAEAILKLETKLAKASLLPAELRDPTKLYHRMELANLKELTPALDWNSYLRDLTVAESSPVNVTVPDFMKAASAVIAETPLNEIKPYLKLRLITSSAKALPKRFMDEYFKFYLQGFYGLKQLPPRWKRCVNATNEMLGFALGRSYIKVKFPGRSKEVAKDLIVSVEKELAKKIDSEKWMDAATKKAAHEKLERLVNHVGYPDKWRNYDDAKVVRDSYLANRFALAEFNERYELGKIGKPVDPNDWDMTPSTVNAYYNPQLDEMVFPAGIMQPPFFNESYTSAANYGAIGMVMGHEMSHGFDDEGRHFDANGSMKDWWTDAAATEFDKRAQCLAKQYDTFALPSGEHINGQLTLGEDIADQGGIRLSYAAWKATLAKDVASDPKALREASKNYFLAFAQSWCSKATPAYEETMVKSNPHPPGRFRVRGALMNSSDFAEAYQCKEGSPMSPKVRCEIW